jgi:hypothetical protein
VVVDDIAVVVVHLTPPAPPQLPGSLPHRTRAAATNDSANEPHRLWEVRAFASRFSPQAHFSHLYKVRAGQG